MILVLFIDPVVDYRLKRKRAFHSFIIKIHDTRVHIWFVISLANPREIRFLFTNADAKDVREKKTFVIFVKVLLPRMNHSYPHLRLSILFINAPVVFFLFNVF